MNKKQIWKVILFSKGDHSGGENFTKWRQAAYDLMTSLAHQLKWNYLIKKQPKIPIK